MKRTRRTAKEVWGPRYAALRDLEQHLESAHCGPLPEGVSLAASAASYAADGDRYAAWASTAKADWGNARHELGQHAGHCPDAKALVKAASKAMSS